MCMVHYLKAKLVFEASVTFCQDLQFYKMSVMDLDNTDFTEERQSANKLIWEVLGFVYKSDRNRNFGAVFQQTHQWSYSPFGSQES